MQTSVPTEKGQRIGVPREIFPGEKRVAKRAVNFKPHTMEAFQPKKRTY